MATEAFTNCQAPEPLSARGLLGLHDSIELFLVLALEHTGAPVTEKDKITFLGYWDRLTEAPQPVALSHKAVMGRLNLARVSFKHYGTMPSRLDLESFARATEEFFNVNTSTVFGAHFESLSFIDLVTLEPVQNLLRDAERRLSEGSVHECLVSCSAAFIELRRQYRRLRWGRVGSPLGIMTPSFTSGDGSELGTDIEVFADEVAAALDVVDDAVEALSLGLDVERLIQFRSFWPRVRHKEDGTWEDNSLLRPLRRPVSAELGRASIDLVIECALVLQRRL